MNFFRKNIANLFTLGNLFAGCVGAVNMIYGNYQITAFCLVISCVLDFFDGFVARAMKSNSALGIQLDSLADMISFGFVPGITMYKALEPFQNTLFGIEIPFEWSNLGFLITAFSCLRLAIFNLDEEQHFYFKGLNTPTNTVLIFGLYYAFKTTNTYEFLFSHGEYLIGLTIATSWLLVSPIKMISMKFKSKQLKDNISKIVLLIGGILVLAILKIPGIPLLVVYYLLISFIFQREFSSKTTH